MRIFSSYGPIDKEMHYHVPRKELIQDACRRLTGEHPEKGGHYITVWAPRQCGKTWIMREVLWTLKKDARFDVVKLNIESLKTEKNADTAARFLAEEIKRSLNLAAPEIRNLLELGSLFTREHLKKPLILIIDEFDALDEAVIAGIVSLFRDIHIKRSEDERPADEKEYLLHSLALIGVRSVIGVENDKGSPFNIQQSMQIPGLTGSEVDAMFQWYQKETGQEIEPAVIQRIFQETRGQPGLVSWFGELLTEKYNPEPNHPLTTAHFDVMIKWAIRALPNNNIINIISKAKKDPYRKMVFELFQTSRRIEFSFDDPQLNYLYMNGIIDIEEGEDLFVLFSSPFVQKRLFNFFARLLFNDMGRIFDPFEDAKEIFEKDGLHIPNLIRRFEGHLQKNREWLLKDVPRRKDLRIFEAIYHFSLYEYLTRFFANKPVKVLPEFPTGNGKVDLLIRFEKRIYALELKSFTDETDFRKALKQAAGYAASLCLSIIHLVVFVESIPEKYREKYEKDWKDEDTGVLVEVVFVETGE